MLTTRPRRFRFVEGGALIAVSYLFPGVALSEEHEPNQKAFTKLLQIGDEQCTVEIVVGDSKVTWTDENGRSHFQDLKNLEMFIQCGTDTRKRVWWTSAHDPGPSAVQGNSIYDVCSLVRNGRPTIFLGIANSYYHWKSLVEIDPGVSITDPPGTGESSTTSNSPNSSGVSASQSRRVEVPEEVFTSRHGTKDLKITCESAAVTMEAKSVAGKTESLRFDLNESKWSKNGESNETADHPAGQ